MSRHVTPLKKTGLKLAETPRYFGSKKIQIVLVCCWTTYGITFWHAEGVIICSQFMNFCELQTPIFTATA